jgi:hypothetical protein
MGTFQPDPMDWTYWDWITGTKKGINDLNPGKRAQDAIRVVFIPWTSAEDDEWTAKTQDWIDINRDEKGKQIQMVHWDPANRPNHILVGLTTHPDAVIYIRGHGSSSSTRIGLRHTGRQGEIEEEKLPIVDACQRLIDMGLDSAFCGTIKFYSCYSATKVVDVAGENKTIRSGNQFIEAGNRDRRELGLAEKPLRPEIDPRDNRSLAKRGADYMRGKGFTNCFFYGYLGPLASTYGDDPSAWVGPNEHKPSADVHRKSVAIAADFVNRPKNLNHLKGSIRASMGRIRV